MHATRFLLCLAAVVLATVPAAARHWRHYPSPPPYAYGWEGEVVRAATARAQEEPGVTREIDPSALQTATGGPSGGLPSSGGR